MAYRPPNSYVLPLPTPIAIFASAIFAAEAVSWLSLSPYIDLAAKAISLVVVLATAAYQIYTFLHDTEEEQRQEHIDDLLTHLAEEEAMEESATCPECGRPIRPTDIHD